MHLTIERIRTLVLVAGGILIAALIAFLAAGRWKNRLSLNELPKRLGANIEQEANGVTYTQSHAGHTLFKIHASKVVQLKQGGRALLHDVQIELYGEDGSRVDRITGNEFEYDQKKGTATAAGPVEIAIMRPGVAPAVAPNAKPGRALTDKTKGTALGSMAQSIAAGQIQVKTSGLIFDQKTGTATTAQRVVFATLQGNGSAMGALFDSEKGSLTLDHDVQLDVHRGAQGILLSAQHAEFERDSLICRLRAASARYRNAEATAAEAQILFRPDGSAVRLDAARGFAMSTSAGTRVESPTGLLEFNEKNQPQRGRMEGGVIMTSDHPGQRIRGTAPSADLSFTPGGELRLAHLERGVAMHSEETGAGDVRVTREWHSPVADVQFRSTHKRQAELASIHGTGGVVITGVTQRGAGPGAPSHMNADEVTAIFGANQQLSEMRGTGHARLSQTTAAGAQQTTSGDRLDVHLAPGDLRKSAHAGTKSPRAGGTEIGSSEIQSAEIDGNVVLVDEPARRAGQSVQAPLRAVGGRAVYDGTGEWVHLTDHPRAESAGLELTADKLDFSQASGDAWARGNVKATWMDVSKDTSATSSGAGVVGVNLGGQGPAHVIANEAQLQESAGVITFRGKARLWQQSNSVEAPILVLDRTRQTLTAHSERSADPVRLVLLSSRAMAEVSQTRKANPGPAGTPSVIRVRAGDLKYSDAEHKAVLRATPGASVVAESDGVRTSSDEVELVLFANGNHAGRDGSAAQVDRLTAKGHVVLTSADRRGAGEKLTYSGESEEYVLTGTAANPPRITDPTHGAIAGDALIFNSRDDSVRVEGEGQKTTTETTAPR